MKNSCKKHTVLFIILVILIALASSLSTGIVQSMFAGNLAMSYWAITLCKGIFSVIPLTLMVKWGTMLAIVCASLSIGLLEETAIRGVMLPLFWQMGI